jgi:dephospho-CoA kinase
MNLINKLIMEVINEEQLDEKLITYNNRKPYGQIVFLAGGAGSGKGFAGSNFLDSAGFKVRDVDEMKKQLQVMNRLGKLTVTDILKKYGKKIKPKDMEIVQKVFNTELPRGGKQTIRNLNLKNADHVATLHFLVKAMGTSFIKKRRL